MMGSLDPAKVRAVAKVLAEELLGRADPVMVAAIVREIEVQFAAAVVLEARTDGLLEKVRQAVVLADTPQSTRQH